MSKTLKQYLIGLVNCSLGLDDDGLRDHMDKLWYEMTGVERAFADGFSIALRDGPLPVSGNA